MAARTGLPPETPVYCGIHDSNASLLPHLLAQEAPFSVVSTGTWVVAMTIGGAPVKLEAARDTLINVSAFGDPVPSARFMGGREFELVRGQDPGPPDEKCAGNVLHRKIMLLPAVLPTSGPFKGGRSRWIGKEPAAGTGERSVAISYYLALVTAECLRLTGHRGVIVVEGPFSRNPDFLSMLASATGCAVRTSGTTTGTAQGAALLALDRRAGFQAKGEITRPRREQSRYAEAWQRAAGQGEVPEE